MMTLRKNYQKPTVTCNGALWECRLYESLVHSYLALTKGGPLFLNRSAASLLEDAYLIESIPSGGKTNDVKSTAKPSSRDDCSSG